MDTGEPRAKPGPWYAEGLNFECQPDCGRCCTNHDEYSYVYLEPDDLHRLAEHFELTQGEFKARYTTRDEGFDVLVMDDPACPFLDGSRCTVYSARPVQCRTFPFWEEHLDSRKAWDGLAEFCPGVNRGPRHPLHVIENPPAGRRG